MSEETAPLGGLPSADRTLLVKAPLEVAVVEVRFLTDETELPSDAGLRLVELLAGSAPELSQLQAAQEGRVSIDFQPGVEPTPSVHPGLRGWQVTDLDGRIQVTMMPGAVVIQVQRYERWSLSMRPLLEAGLEAARILLQPKGVVRIGLRYVDRFVDSEASSASAWAGRMNESLLGPVRHDVFGRLVSNAQQQVQLGLERGRGAILRHGPFVDQAAGGAVSYLLDIDVFDQEATPFHCEDVVTRAEVLNRTAASLFQLCLTQDYLLELQGKQTNV